MSQEQPRRAFVLGAAGLVAGALTVASRRADACCPAPPSGKPVVNADQTVIIVWDAASSTQHFIRRASFKSDADDFGFLVPTPSQPELAESGNEAFSFLQKLTEPEVITERRPLELFNGCGCSRSKGQTASPAAPSSQVTVLEQKTVAGFQAVVLQASSASALIGWLQEHGYAFSPEVESWARPYVDGGWKITALRVAKESKHSQQAAAAALRMSFKTDRPLFPYREPASEKSASALGATSRLLRIYFIGEARYGGHLPTEQAWTGNVAWAGKLSPEDRSTAAGMLNIPPDTGARDWWLTEFEDPWPYREAPGDLHFAPSREQGEVRREPIIRYVSLPDSRSTNVALGTVALLPLLLHLRRRTSSRRA